MIFVQLILIAAVTAMAVLGLRSRATHGVKRMHRHPGSSGPSGRLGRATRRWGNRHSRCSRGCAPALSCQAETELRDYGCGRYNAAMREFILIRGGIKRPESRQTKLVAFGNVKV